MSVARRFERIVRSWIADARPPASAAEQQDRTGHTATDADTAAAWLEIEAFLRREAAYSGHQTSKDHPAEALRADFAALEVEFGAPLNAARTGYRRLIGRYHPDRFGNDRQRHDTATEIVARLNAAMQRIEAHYALQKTDGG